MKQISTLSSSPRQKLNFITESGKTIDMTFRYLATQSRWVLDFSYENGFSVNGLAVVCSPNMLDKYRNMIDFGINVMSVDWQDPWSITSFSDGLCAVSVLNDEEKNMAARYLDGEEL